MKSVNNKTKVLLLFNVLPIFVAYCVHLIYKDRVGSVDATVTIWAWLALFIVFILDIVALTKYQSRNKSSKTPQTPLVLSKRVLALIVMAILVFIVGFTIFFVSHLQI